MVSLGWVGQAPVRDMRVRDLPKCPPIAGILAYTTLPDRAATVRERWLTPCRHALPHGRGSDWGFTVVHFYVARLAGAVACQPWCHGSEPVHLLYSIRHLMYNPSDAWDRASLQVTDSAPPDIGNSAALIGGT